MTVPKFPYSVSFTIREQPELRMVPKEGERFNMLLMLLLRGEVGSKYKWEGGVSGRDSQVSDAINTLKKGSEVKIRLTGDREMRDQLVLQYGSSVLLVDGELTGP